MIGRSKDAHVQLHGPTVSRRHAVATYDAGSGWILEDTASTAGTHVGTERIARRAIGSGLEARLGDEHSGVSVRLQPTSSRTPTVRRVRIGRAADNDLRVEDPLVSRHHADLRVAGSGLVLTDLGSHNGTFVNGRRVDEVPLQPGDRVSVGASSFQLMGDQLVRRSPRAASVLRAHDVSVQLGRSGLILNNVAFDVRAGEFVAIVGPTGSGKSTLVKVLTGSRPPEGGDVILDDRSLYDHLDEFRKRIGYVPQDDILHEQLTLRRELDYGAALRFPIDMSASERQERCEEVTAALGLEECADVPIAKLSGGQRKRTNVALELLRQPDLIFLDEPTSGLDPWFEKSVMRLLRQLATEERAVVAVTHSVASLDLCNRVLFLAAGGTVAFYGTPEAARRHFRTSDFVDVFQHLARPRPVPDKPAVRARTPGAQRPPRRNWRETLAHTRLLVSRQATVWASDWRNFAFFATEVLVPTLLILALVKPGSLRTGRGATGGRTLLAAIVISATAIAAGNSLREIVKEVPLYLRERAAGVSRGAYLISKVGAIGVLTSVQIAILVTVATARAHGPTSGNVLPPRLELLLDVTAVGIATVALGLLISSLVSTSEKAMALIAVVFVVEWLFAGVAVDLSARPLLQPIGFVTTANWGVAASASSVDLYRIEGSCGTARPPVPPVPATLSCDGRWRAGVGRWLLSLTGLAALTAVALAGTAIALRHKEPG